MPVCPGDVNRAPRPKYPEVAASDGYVGAVIVVYDVDEAGKLNPRVAASVPTDIFDEAALKSVERLRWKWEDSEPDAPPCRKQIEEVVQSFEFVLQSSTDIFRSR
ncbi:energy transducer TonB [Henriciella marina]|uniref:energy transducer TonB n=1 Tax=Henriciella marina TaxID=453851 RepID=UPI003898FDA1